jgi:hypothetical protein
VQLLRAIRPGAGTGRYISALAISQLIIACRNCVFDIA